MDRSIASLILAASGEVVAMTSSSCMIMSEPMVFCKEIECSGVSNLGVVSIEVFARMPEYRSPYIGVPSCGLWKRTPSSVTLASFSRLTIWNLSRDQLEQKAAVRRFPEKGTWSFR